MNNWDSRENQERTEDTELVENTGKNNNNSFLKGILAVFIIATIILGGYIVYDKFMSKSQSTETETEEPTSVKQVSKFDSARDWVYDAEYPKNVTKQSYTTMLDSTYYADSIIVPYFNIDSDYASKANKEVKGVFDEAVDAYNDGISDGYTYIDECNYKTYINNGYLSVALTLGIGATDEVIPYQYYTYNFNLKDGSEMSYEDVYKIAGFKSDNIDDKVKNAIDKKLKEIVGDFVFPEDESINTYKDESIANYFKSVKDNTLEYFISDEGKLKVAVTLITPFIPDERNVLLTIE